MATEGGEGVPIGGSEHDGESVSSLIESLTQRIAELERQLKPKASEDYDPHRLKPIDIKDIEKPDKYDNDITKFVVWYDRFRDLLMNRHPYWEYLLDAVEKQGKTKIHDHKEFMANMDVGDEEARQSITRQEAQYCQQLKSYIRTYSTGELYARTTQTKSTEVLELMREIVHKGRNRNPNRLIDLKAKALSPQRATKAADLDRILTEWRHVRQQIVEEEQSYKMSDDTKQTILLRIMPQEYVKDMRELLTSGKYNDDYYGFEQALYDEINTRKMDEESRKGSGRIGAITEKEGWGGAPRV